MNLFNFKKKIYNFSDLYSEINFKEFSNWLDSNIHFRNSELYSGRLYNLPESGQVNYYIEVRKIKIENLIIYSDYNRRVDADFDQLEVLVADIITLDKSKNNINDLVKQFNLKAFS
jgi:hypothetical protein